MARERLIIKKSEKKQEKLEGLYVRKNPIELEFKKETEKDKVKVITEIEL